MRRAYPFLSLLLAGAGMALLWAHLSLLRSYGPWPYNVFYYGYFDEYIPLMKAAWVVAVVWSCHRMAMRQYRLGRETSIWKIPDSHYRRQTIATYLAGLAFVCTVLPPNAKFYPLFVFISWNTLAFLLLGAAGAHGGAAVLAGAACAVMGVDRGGHAVGGQYGVDIIRPPVCASSCPG